MKKDIPYLLKRCRLRKNQRLLSLLMQKDEKLIAAYNQVIHFKRIVDRLEPQVLELQGVLKINESLKKEVDELQRVHVGIGEVVGEVGAQARAVGGDATAKSFAAAEGVATE
ncbi:hypothetical protein ACFX1Z_000661 [Malus domestica]